jgi:hypothetical protein
VLSLNSNNLQAAGGKALAEGLKGNQVITELDISGNYLGLHTNGNADASGITAIADASGITAIADAIPDMRALLVLSLKNNSLRAAGGKALAEGLKGNQVVTELNIASNDLGLDGRGDADTSGVIALADVIPDMGALTTLTFGDNQVTMTT